MSQTEGQHTPTPTACPGDTFYPDSDGDGYGLSAAASCETFVGSVLTGGDCDDTRGDVHPDQPERCDGRDTDCDGAAEIRTTWYPDADGDGYGDDGKPTLGCDRPAGYVPLSGDCDDSDDEIGPRAQERCAEGLVDEDCDGLVDEGAGQTFYLDSDGDGFGHDQVRLCAPEPGAVANRGDCDDTDPDISPGATDVVGDGIDSDCGGTDSPEPHVGLSPISRPTLQQAIDAAREGAVVWVGPGTYVEAEVTFRGKHLTLMATQPGEATEVNAAGGGSVFVFNKGEGPAATLDGLTLTGGDAGPGAGGGAFISFASPTLRGCVITRNRATRGGGIYLENGSPDIIDCLVSRNTADLSGGGIELHTSGPTLSGSRLVANQAVEGGGLYATGSQVYAAGAEISGNIARSNGGGGLIDATVVTFDGGLINGNTAGDAGGGLWMNSAGVSFKGTVILGNRADDGDGGGLLISSGQHYFDGAQFVGNSCSGEGGGAWIKGSSMEARGARFEANTADSRAGGAFSTDAYTLWIDCVFKGNRVVGLSSEGGGGLYLKNAGSDLIRVALDSNVAGGALGVGGGLLIDAAAPVVTNVMIKGNLAGWRGGGMALRGSSPPTTQAVLVGNSAYQGGGIYFEGASAPTIHNSVLAHNAPNNHHSCCFDSGDPAPAPWFVFTDQYNAPGHIDVAPPYYAPDMGNVFVEPKLQAYDDAGLPTDLHLSLTSWLVNRGDPSVGDADSGRSDMGAYGGPEGDGWDLDGDGAPGHFWPGSWADAPAGVNTSAVDCDDTDPLVKFCP